MFIDKDFFAISLPKGVKKTVLLVLSTNLMFNNFSISCIPELRVDWLTKHSLAALPKCKFFEIETSARSVLFTNSFLLPVQSLYLPVYL